MERLCASESVAFARWREAWLWIMPPVGPLTFSPDWCLIFQKLEFPSRSTAYDTTPLRNRQAWPACARVPRFGLRSLALGGASLGSSDRQPHASAPRSTSRGRVVRRRGRRARCDCRVVFDQTHAAL